MGSSAVTSNRFQSIQDKVDELERKLKEFDDRVRLLIWVGGLLAVAGFTLAGVSSWVHRTEKALVERRTEIERLQKTADNDKETLARIQAQMSDAQNAGSALEQMVKQKKQELAQYAKAIQFNGQSAAASESAALQQVLRLQQASPPEPYYPRGQTEDIGQMYNCVSLFISEMKVNKISREFHSQKPFYEAIEQLYATLQARAQRKISSSLEPDQGNLTWHTKGWFDRFYDTLTKMKQENMEGNLTDGELDTLQDDFRNNRDSLWGPAFHDWPPSGI